MFDRIITIFDDLPIGTLIFLGVLLWSFFGKKDKKEAEPGQPRPAKPAPAPAPPPSNYASEDRRNRSEWGHSNFQTPDERYANDDWGHPTFESPDSRYASDQWGQLDFGTPENRYRSANEWGQTEYGFESATWESGFDDARDDEPRIHR